MTDDPFSAAFGKIEPEATPSGASDDPFRAAFGDIPAAMPPGVAAGKVKTLNSADVEKPAGPGSVNAFAGGVIEGLPVVGPAVKSGVDQGVAWLRSLSSGKTPEEELEAIKAMSERTKAEHPIASTAGEITGQLAGYGAGVVAAPTAFGIGMPLVSGAATSGITNALVAAADAYARGEDPIKAATIGGGLGVAAPVVGRAAQKLFTSYVVPEVARLADLAIHKFGIPLGADLLSSNPMIRFASSVVERMPMTGGTAAREARQAAFNRAVARTIGETDDLLTPAAMSRARTRIGGMFEGVANRTPTIGADSQFGDDLTRILDDIRNPVDRALAADERAVVEKHLNRVIELFQRSGNGTITGRQYQQLTRRGTALDRAAGSANPNIAYYAQQIKSALDDVLSRFAPPEALADLATAKQQWWALKTIEPLAAESPLGNISTAKLMHRVANNSQNMAYGSGGDLADLARIGQAFLKEAPSSGTAERALIGKILTEAGSAAGFWAMFQHPTAAILGLGLPVAVGRAAGAVARSPRIANALVRAAIRGPGPIARGAEYGAAAALPAGRRPLQRQPLVLDMPWPVDPNTGLPVGQVK